MAVLKSTNFSEKVSQEIFSKVTGKSSLAKLSGQKPIPFNGTKEFTFSLDKEVDIVAEGGAKGVGGATVAPVTIVPIKVEYGARISDEFMYASEEEGMNILQSWIDGFSKKLARAIDIMALHGVNPRSKEAASGTIGNNYFDYIVTNEVVYDEDTPDANLESAIALIDGYDITGIALSKAFAAAMAAMKTTGGAYLYPEFKFGQNPNSFAGMTSDVNSTIDFNNGLNKAYVGDFANAFKWGIAKNIPLEVIEYGNPDNDAEAGDLKGHNQVYLRGEAYVGWGILDKNAFARVEAEAVVTG